MLVIRSDREFLYKQRIFSNLPLLGAVLLTCGLQLAAIHLPLANEIFKTQPLSFRELIICAGASAVLFHAVELEKWLNVKFGKRTINDDWNVSKKRIPLHHATGSLSFFIASRELSSHLIFGHLSKGEGVSA